MNKILEQINSPEDLRRLKMVEKKTLCNEIRNEIIDVTSKNGGHVASNLGVVELTVVLHSVFNTPKDKIIWDVGHQCYVHKILTGRRQEFKTIRQLGGISGFPKICESEYDNFNTGHSSTSISVATGMARARDILKEDYEVIAVIGLPSGHRRQVLAKGMSDLQAAIGCEVVIGCVIVLAVGLRRSALEILVQARRFAVALLVVVCQRSRCPEFGLAEQ